jgi:hypothetical protein
MTEEIFKKEKKKDKIRAEVIKFYVWAPFLSHWYLKLL